MLIAGQPLLMITSLFGFSALAASAAVPSSISAPSNKPMPYMPFFFVVSRAEASILPLSIFSLPFMPITSITALSK